METQLLLPARLRNRKREPSCRLLPLFNRCLITVQPHLWEREATQWAQGRQADQQEGGAENMCGKAAVMR